MAPGGAVRLIFPCGTAVWRGPLPLLCRYVVRLYPGATVILYLVCGGGQDEQKSLLKRWETTVIESKTKRPATMSGQVTGVWRAALLAGAAAVFMAGQVIPADAQFFRQLQPQYRQPEPQSRQDTTRARKANRPPATQSKRDVPIRQPFGENMPKGPLQLMVSIGDQRAVLYSNGVRVAETKVSTGTPAIRRRPACSASSRRTAGIARTSTAMRRCSTCTA